MMERDTTIAVRWHRRPALSEIIDEQDEIDFMEGGVVIDLMLEDIKGSGSVESVTKNRSR